jgi:hypothetical protein
LSSKQAIFRPSKVKKDRIIKENILKKMFILMSHEMTQLQQQNAKELLDIETFMDISDPIWSTIPSECNTIESYLQIFKDNLHRNSSAGDYLFVQGDFGATYLMVSFAKSIGVLPVYATTKRVSRDIVEGDKIITIREFKHVQFREYGI